LRQDRVEMRIYDNEHSVSPKL